MEQEQQQQQAAPRRPWWQANPHLLPTLAAALLALAGEAGGALGLPVWAVRLLYAGAILTGGFSTGRKGLRNLSKFQFDMNALMTIAVTGACLIGQWSEGAVVAVLFGISEMLESYTIDRARQSIRTLMAIAPKLARVRRASGVSEIPVEEVAVGDLLLVRPGERIAMDGVVRAGASSVNQAAITGESMPVERQTGDEVFAGTINGEGALEVAVTRRSGESRLARIIYLVEEAQAQRAPSQTFVEKFARYYTPAIMLLAALIAAVPPVLLGLPWTPWLYRGLSLLVVGCPCALVVSTPVTIVSAIANGARNGVLIKGGAHLERVGALSAIAFDKTGTLTMGCPEVTDICTESGIPSGDLICMANAVEEHSEHPLARAIRRRDDCGRTEHDATDFQAIVGRGARAVVDGREVYVGSPALFAEALQAEGCGLIETARQWQAEGKTVVVVGSATEVMGALAVADTPRQDSRGVLAALKEAGIARTVLLTGDNAATAAIVGTQVGVDEVRSELMPDAKVTAVEELRQRYGTVGMVGDGINDAPALAAATVGIAMGKAGTDVALETADIALMSDDLTRLPFVIRLGRQSLAVIKQNIGLALGLKLLAVAAVFPGWLTLWIAIVADMGATILVTLNGMRLLRVKPEG